MSSKGRTKLGLSPLSPSPSLGPQVASRLRNGIFEGVLAPGTRLVEPALAAELGISRGPVREALQRLAAEGLVTEEPRHGYRVVMLTATDVREICELRAAIEGRATQILAASRRGGSLEELDSILRRLEVALVGTDPRTSIDLDLAFHEALCRLSGNRRLHAAFLVHAPVLRTLFRLDSDVFGLPASGTAQQQHRLILDAVATDNPSMAQEAIDVHMRQAERLWQESLGHRSEGSDSSAKPKPKL